MYIVYHSRRQIDETLPQARQSRISRCVEAQPLLTCGLLTWPSACSVADRGEGPGTLMGLCHNRLSNSYQKSCSSIPR